MVWGSNTTEVGSHAGEEFFTTSVGSVSATGESDNSPGSKAALNATLLGGGAGEGPDCGEQVSLLRGGEDSQNLEPLKTEGQAEGLGEEGKQGGEAGGGTPDSPEGYVFDFSSGVVVDEQALAAFKEIAFEQGISQQQASSIAHLYASLVEQQAAGEQATLAETEEAWLKELRQSRHYAKTVASARLTMERFGTPELNELFNETRLGSHPALVRFVAKIGQELGEPVFMQGKGQGKTGKLNFYETMEG